MLRESGLPYDLIYPPNEVQELGKKNEERKHKRMIILLSPHHSEILNTNVDNVFLK